MIRVGLALLVAGAAVTWLGRATPVRSVEGMIGLVAAIVCYMAGWVWTDRGVRAWRGRRKR